MLIWNIPFARNPFFTGREDLLEKLQTQLRTTKVAAVSHPQAISGLGGIGKTQLAIEYAYHYRQEYQAVLWARADTTEALNASYTELAGLLHLPQKDAQEQEVVVQAMKAWLRSNGGWLLILDNADDLNLVQPFLPTECPGHLVLTTRAQITGKVMQRFEVDTLDGEAGALLLLRRAGLVAADGSFDAAFPSDQSIALVLVEELGGLPLALDQAGAYIEETQCSLADYREQYQMRRAELLARRGKLVDDHPEPVATTWSLSFARVEQTNPIATALLRACAFLASDAIPEELLVEVLKTPLPSANRRRGWKGWFSWLTAGYRQKPNLPSSAKSEGEINEALATLRAYSLIQRNTVDKTVQVHRLVQAVVRDAIEEQEQVIWIIHIVCGVSALFPKGEYDTWKQCARYLPHVLMCDKWIAQRNLTLPEGVSLLQRAGHYLYNRAQYKEAEPLITRSLRIKEQQLGARHPDTAHNLINLASLYSAQGKYEEAEALYQRALPNLWGAKDPEIAYYLNNLADLYGKLGRYAEAELLYQRALSITEQQLGPTHPATALQLSNLAGLYHYQERYAEEEQLIRRALSITEQQLGPTHPATARILNNLAVLCRVQRKYEEAELLYQRVLATSEQQLGTTHLSTALALDNLAALYKLQEKYAEAELFSQRALSIFEERLGASHPDIAINLSNLALLYKTQKKYSEAEPLYQRALTISEQQLGATHPSTALYLTNLAVLYEAQEKYAEAEPLYQRALAIREQQLGTMHPSTKRSFNNLAALYIAQAKYAEVASLEQRFLAIGEQVLGLEHPDTVQSLLLLGSFYEQQQHYREAKPLYERALAIFKQTLGSEHSSTRTMQKHYISLLEKMKQEKSDHE